MLHPSQAVSLCVVKPTSQYLWGKTEGCILGYREIPCLKIFDFLIKWKEHNSWHRERVSWTERKGCWDLPRAFWTQTVLHYNCRGALLLFDTLYIKELKSRGAWNHSFPGPARQSLRQAWKWWFSGLCLLCWAYRSLRHLDPNKGLFIFLLIRKNIEKLSISKVNSFSSFILQIETDGCI